MTTRGRVPIFREGWNRLTVRCSDGNAIAGKRYGNLQLHRSSGFSRSRRAFTQGNAGEVKRALLIRITCSCMRVEFGRIGRELQPQAQLRNKR